MLLSELGALRMQNLKGILAEQHEQVIAVVEGILALEEAAGFGASDTSSSKIEWQAPPDVADPAHAEPVIDYQHSQSTYLSDEDMPADMPVPRERNADDDGLEISYLQVVNALMGSEAPEELTHVEAAGSDERELRTADSIVVVPAVTQSLKWDTSQSELKEKARAISEARKSRRARISDFSSLAARGNCSAAIRAIVQHRFFEIAAACSIVGNAVLLGIEVQFVADNRSVDTPEVFKQLEYVFTATYIVELLFRFVAEGLSFLSPLKRYARWNYFDVMCVFSSIIGLVMDGLSVEAKHASAVSTSSRFARIGRVARILRLVKFVTQLRAIVATLWSTVSSMFWALALMSFVMYIFAVIITQAAVTHSFQNAGTDMANTLDLNFGSVPLAIYTLFKSVTNGNSWEIAAEVLMRVHPIYFYLYIVYVSVIVFAFMNVMTGFICEQAIATVQRDKEMAVEAQVRHKEVYSRKFAELFGNMDNFNSGEITVDELEKHIGDDTVRAYFEHLDLDVDKAWDIFRLLDIDESGTVSMDEFVVGCLKLRGQARSMDLAIIGYDFQRVAEKLSEFMEFVEKQLIEMNRVSGDLRYRFSQEANSHVMSRRSIITGRKSIIRSSSMETESS